METNVSTEQNHLAQKEQSLQKVHELLGRTKLNMNEQWMFDNYWNEPEFEFLKDDRGKLQVHRIDAVKIKGVSNEELWGEDLFKVFGNHINEDGWLTSDWAQIIEDEVPRFDTDYNDNPEHSETYSRMYNLDYEENADQTLIRPLKQYPHNI
jgi:hypothetical protein